MKTVRNLFFGQYIGKKVTINEDGYYYCGDYIPGRFYSGILNDVSYCSRGLVLKIDGTCVTVNDYTIITFEL